MKGWFEYFRNIKQSLEFTQDGVNEKGQRRMASLVENKTASVTQITTVYCRKASHNAHKLSFLLL